MNPLPDWMREPVYCPDPSLWDEENEGRAIEYVRAHIDDMHDDFDVAPFVRRILSITEDDMPREDKDLLLASIAWEIRDAHIRIALDDIRRRDDA